jgi:hypothetical protein
MIGFDASARPDQAGSCQLLVWVRSDPFYAEAEGALHGFQWTGKLTFTGKNVLAIVLEVSNARLNTDPAIGV